MKKMRKLAVLTAAVLLCSTVCGAISVSAETSYAEYPAYLESEEEQGDLLAGIEEYNLLWNNILGDLSQFSFESWYLVYGFWNMEPRSQCAMVTVKKDGVWAGCMFVCVEPDDDPYVHYFPRRTEDASEELYAALDAGKPVLFATSHGYWVNGKLRTMFYVDGVTYDLERDEVVGGAPDTLEYLEYRESLPLDEDELETTQPVQTTQPPADLSSGEPQIGDVNQDGAVNILDAVLLSRIANGSVQLSESLTAVADCNCDGAVGNEDTITLLRFLIHLIDKLG